MNARDELEAVIYKARWVDGMKSAELVSDFELAKTIISDGYVKHCTVTTVEELEALPVSSVVLTHRGGIFTKFYDMHVESDNWEAKGSSSISHEDLPATVLYEPEVTA